LILYDSLIAWAQESFHAESDQKSFPAPAKPWSFQTGGNELEGFHTKLAGKWIFFSPHSCCSIGIDRPHALIIS